MISKLPARLHSRLKRLVRRSANGRPIPAEADFALAVPFGEQAITADQFKIAVMIHLFHPEMSGEFRTLCNALPAPCDLLITTDTEEKAGLIAGAFQGWDAGNVTILTVPNKGRDIAPKLTAYADRYNDFDLVLFLHSKKSGTVDWGDDWRQQILSSLCGNEQIVRSITSLFARDEKLGMVAPKSFARVHEMMRWGDTADATKLAERLGFTLDFNGQMDFPAGSMFWARPSALKPLLDLQLSAADFPEEAGQTDATLAHAVERLFYLVCEQAGYTWLKVAEPTFFHDTSSVLPVEDKGELSRATSQATRSISATMLK